ncbi:hypothetical protein S40288_10681 [Stachybotrys chartarum IBT 40288]|nr:hypothetical protein S40288_10681 [Stachybotrys chartarum IBT 40288]
MPASKHNGEASQPPTTEQILQQPVPASALKFLENEPNGRWMGRQLGEWSCKTEEEIRQNCTVYEFSGVQENLAEIQRFTNPALNSNSKDIVMMQLAHAPAHAEPLATQPATDFQGDMMSQSMVLDDVLTEHPANTFDINYQAQAPARDQGLSGSSVDFDSSFDFSQLTYTTNDLTSATEPSFVAGNVGWAFVSGPLQNGMTTETPDPMGQSDSVMMGDDFFNGPDLDTILMGGTSDEPQSGWPLGFPTV